MSILCSLTDSPNVIVTSANSSSLPLDLRKHEMLAQGAYKDNEATTSHSHPHHSRPSRTAHNSLHDSWLGLHLALLQSPHLFVIELPRQLVLVLLVEGLCHRLVRWGNSGDSWLLERL